MKTYLNFSEPSFYIDEKERVVVCTIKCRINRYDHPAWRLMYPELWKPKFPKINDDDYFMVKGRARCHIEDTWDESLGKHLAESRAKFRAYLLASKVFNTCKQKVERLTKDLDITLQVLLEMGMKECIHINELKGEYGKTD